MVFKERTILLIVLLCVGLHVCFGRQHHHHNKTHHHHAGHHNMHHRHGTLNGHKRCPPGQSRNRPFLDKGTTPGHLEEEEEHKGCSPCPGGTYMPHHNFKRSCFVCSRCGAGLYMAHPCLPWRDTLCDSCHTFKGPHNLEYQTRCLRSEAALEQVHNQGESQSQLKDDLKVQDKSCCAKQEALTGSDNVEGGEEDVTSRGQLLSTILISATASCGAFLLILLVIFGVRWRRINKYRNAGPYYAPVELQEQETVQL